MKRRLYKIFLFLTLGLVTSLAVAMVLALLVDVQQGVQSQADSFDGDEHWTVTRIDRAGAAQITSIRTRGSTIAWSPQQAAGPPNTPTQGDQHSAWASKGTTVPEWLILDYAKPVIPRELHVYESYNPGALTKVSIFDAQGNEIVAWTGIDPSPPNTGTSTQTNMPTRISKIQISLNVPTQKVKIYISSDKVPGWNEIDAVGLIGDKQELQWAKHVTASSTYASTSDPTSGQGNPENLAPAWSGLHQRTPAFQEARITTEERRVDARGWPMLALRSETVVSAAPTPSAVSPSGTQLLPLTDYAIPGKGGSAYSPGVTTYSGLTVPGGYTSGTLGPAMPTTPTAPVPVPVPLHPIWIGLLGDTLFYAIVWVGLWATLVIPRRFIREVARFRRGTCIQCGYDLGYDFVNGCPECGWRRDQHTAPASSRSTESQRMS